MKFFYAILNGLELNYNPCGRTATGGSCKQREELDKVCSLLLNSKEELLVPRRMEIA
jgi:hypothetical protein